MDSSAVQDAKQTNIVPAKTPYTAPKLSIHGSVQQITQSIAGNVSDGTIGSLTLATDE
jgi:hypothetical protein